MLDNTPYRLLTIKQIAWEVVNPPEKEEDILLLLQAQDEQGC